MEKTPNTFRKHIVLLGSVNAGKSTLFNALTGQDGSIVSATPGTTTDPVRAAMELLPFGPVVLIDTAGLGDVSGLGTARMQKTVAVRRRADAAIYVWDATEMDIAAYDAFRSENLPHLLVLTKWDLVAEERKEALQKQYPHGLLFSGQKKQVEAIRRETAALLEQQQPDDDTILGDLLPEDSKVILVAPMDSEAPKGRLILPQVQLLRDCLDHGIQCTVCRETELESTLQNLKQVDLVVTDSQVFAYVSQQIPRELPLTSFSILLARQKGNFAQLLAGANAIEGLGDEANILMLEGCTHNHTHEDIGRVKIPALLQKRTGKSLRFDFYSGYDFPTDLIGYNLAIQCGNCMLNKREVTSRLAAMDRAGLPVTNYGIALAWANGILERCCEIFGMEENS